MKILHLKLKKKWFDMIASGEKLEEYREMNQHWRSRLLDPEGNGYQFRNFDVIRFQNGYGEDRPTMLVKFEGVKIGIGKYEWGHDLVTPCYIISLGEIVYMKNYENPERQEA